MCQPEDLKLQQQEKYKPELIFRTLLNSSVRCNLAVVIFAHPSVQIFPIIFFYSLSGTKTTVQSVGLHKEQISIQDEQIETFLNQ